MTIEPARPFLLLLKTHVKRLLIACFTGLWCLHATAAPTSAPVRAEIEALLTKLQASGCQFNRNGSWYTGSEAKAHLLRKLEYVEGKGTVQSTEHFIELAASKSSFSGRSYQVRCGGQAPVASQVWLIQQLAVVRAPTSSTIKP
ncbi:MAG: DUF5329 domain-containing protein [Limnobacter sp.]|uniref:DUF5329 domain-containing protein n=1 Tax=Limnobacter sp. TaxID=2003368 RepID=UPI0022C15522|nr:DUF5329 domain-containing protein [Limnobacter sp.]MCZ8014467.1 DUF5329 domain-containing protein [Limnobacter sp.]